MPGPTKVPVPTVGDIRSKYPGAYDDLDDAALDRLIQRKFNTPDPTEALTVDAQPIGKGPAVNQALLSPPPGLQQPNMDNPEVATRGNNALMQAMPPLLGLGASFLPVGGPATGLLTKTALKMLLTGGAGGMAEAGREAIQGEPFSGSNIVGESLVNAGPSVLEGIGGAIAKGGKGLLGRAIRNGRSTTSGEAFTRDIAGKPGISVPTQELGIGNLRPFADTMAKYGITVSEKGFAKAVATADTLRQGVLKAQSGSAQEKALLRELHAVERLAPEIKQVVNRNEGTAGLARGLTGSGAVRGGLLAGGAIAGAVGAGIDPATIGAMSAIIGLPALAIEASPKWRSVAGLAMQKARVGGIAADKAVRLALAEMESGRPTHPKDR